MKGISAIIVAHNEEDKIEGCLKSLEFVDEIVVVLDKCSDGTKKIVEKYTDKIIEGSWNIEGQRRNIALKNASHDWLLELDADERISKELAQEIINLESDTNMIFDIKVNNYVGNRLVKYGWLKTIGISSHLALFYKGCKIYHEDKEIHPTVDLKGQVKYLKNPIIHYMDNDIADLIKRFNRNTDWRAQDFISSGKEINRGIFKEILSIKIRIIKSFIIKKGYKEGALGLLIAILGSLYPTVSRLKAQEIKNNENN